MTGIVRLEQDGLECSDHLIPRTSISSYKLVASLLAAILKNYTFSLNEIRNHNVITTLMSSRIVIKSPSLGLHYYRVKYVLKYFDQVNYTSVKIYPCK